MRPEGEMAGDTTFFEAEQDITHARATLSILDSVQTADAERAKISPQRTIDQARNRQLLTQRGQTRLGVERAREEITRIQGIQTEIGYKPPASTDHPQHP